jgi:hypothetical protein
MRLRLAGPTLPILALALCIAGCAKNETNDTPPMAAVAPPAVAACEAGIRKAAEAGTVREATSLYYEQCAEMLSAPTCRDAFRAAAKVDPSQQMMTVMDPCRKAYCPLVTGLNSAICGETFVATPEAVLKEWPKLMDAILQKEAHEFYGDINGLLMGLYVHTTKLMTVEAQHAAASAAPSGAPSAGAPPASSASTGAPAGSAGAPVHSAGREAATTAPKAEKKTAAAAPAHSAR